MGIDWKKVLPVVSSIGVAITGGLSFWGGMKYHEKKEEKGKKALLYLLPGVASAVGTVVSIGVTGHITGKEIAVLTATSTYLVAERDKFKEVLNEKLVKDVGMPEEKAKETIQEVQEETHKRMAAEVIHNGEKFSVPSIEETGHGDLLCIEGWSGRAFRASREWVEAGIRKLNTDYITPVIINTGNKQIKYSPGGVCLNDLYDNWGIRNTHFGYENGWPENSDYVEYFTDVSEGLGLYTTLIEKTELGEPILFIEFSQDMYPLQGWYEY